MNIYLMNHINHRQASTAIGLIASYWRKFSALLPLWLVLVATTTVMASHAQAKADFVAIHSLQPVVVDANDSDTVWQQATWYPLDKHMIGDVPLPEDFSGRFKLAWDADYLYLLVELQDDVLFDQHPDPLYKYWDDDALEIFIDEDASGGDHLYNYNAFAYHIALDHQAIDIGGKTSDGGNEFVALNSHINSAWQRQQRQGSPIIWEVAMEIHDDSFHHNVVSAANARSRVTLNVGKQLGFMLAYCDNDGSKEREHFLGSTEITPVNGDKNLGYKTADVFGKLLLVSAPAMIER
ncbi:sugar-binding protein [Thalassotalea maritima]|uniref:sugar-binding protein n=1 Tax=Thalassotalea maritima TaxID=3242416 RepID=UPI003527BE3D